MSRYVLALDQGTTSSRAILFDNEQNIIAVRQREFEQLYPQQGWVEHDPMEIWSSQYGVMNEVVAQSGVDAHAAVGVVAAENARIVILAFLEGNDRRVENAVRRRKRVARDDRIGRIAPHHFLGAGGTILPRHIRHGRAYDFQVIHNYLSFGLSS